MLIPLAIIINNQPLLMVTPRIFLFS